MAELIALNLFAVLLAFELGWKMRGARDAAWIVKTADALTWQYRRPVYQDIHQDQDCLPTVPPPNIWAPPKREPFWVEQATVYERFRARRWRT